MNQPPADNTSNKPILIDGSGTNDSPSKVVLPVPSPAQPLKKSTSESIKPKDKNSSHNLGLSVGEPLKLREQAGNALIRVAEESSGAELSVESKDIIQQYMQNACMGFLGVIPMKCRGQACPFLASCPLHLAGSALPVGSNCPVEKAMITIWVSKHLKALGIEDVTDPMNSFDMDLLYELAGQELIRWRCGVHLSDDPSLVSRELTNVTITGHEIFTDIINPVLDVMERAGKNIQKIRDALVATREAQIKAGQENKDPSQHAAALRIKAAEILKQKREYLTRLQDRRGEEEKIKQITIDTIDN